VIYKFVSTQNGYQKRDKKLHDIYVLCSQQPKTEVIYIIELEVSYIKS
jgi:hypothetical protein